MSRAADHLKRTDVSSRKAGKPSDDNAKFTAGTKIASLKSSALSPVASDCRLQQQVIALLVQRPKIQGIAGSKLNLSLREVDQETGEDQNRYLRCFTSVLLPSIEERLHFRSLDFTLFISFSMCDLLGHPVVSYFSSRVVHIFFHALLTSHEIKKHSVMRIGN